MSVVITHALRTPIGKFQGALSPLSAVDLGAHVVREILARSGIQPADVAQVLFGQARQLGSGPNPARQITLKGGCPDTVPAMTVNQACGSGLHAIWLGRQAIACGDASVVIAGGVESMTNIPFLLPKARAGYRLGHDQILDGNYQDGFTCGVLKEPMGMTAEYLADRYELGREEQDRYALRSFERAEQAIAAGHFKSEIAPIAVPAGKGESLRVSEDEHPRKGMTLQALAKLPPVFRPKGGPKEGTVHPGNSSGITDGAAAVLLMTDAEAKRRGLPILASVDHGIVRGVDPKYMGIGPVPAVRDLCTKEKTTPDAFDLIELNEAFAAQVIACDRELKLPADRLNVNGGAIALGHPIGATGARIVVTLLHELQRRGGKRGLATLCMSGGMGMAVSFTRP
jgi:acetyl-CoA C-acetyltransferase